MNIESKKRDIINNFEKLTECLNFPKTPLRELSIYLAFLYVSTEKMRPYGSWRLPHKAYSDSSTQDDLSILFEDFARIEISYDEANNIWGFLKGFSLHNFLSLFDQQLTIKQIDATCSILEKLYSSSYATVFHLYLLLKCYAYDYSWYYTHYTELVNKMKITNNIGDPLSEHDYSLLYNAVHKNNISINHKVFTNGDAIELYDSISIIATSKEQKLKLYSQYRSLSEKSTSNERYITLAKQVNPSDILLAQDSIGEAEIECNIIFGRIFSRQAKKVLIGNPSIELIRLLDKKCHEVNSYRNKLDKASYLESLKVYILVDTEIKAALLRKEFRNLVFFPIEKFLGLRAIDSFYYCATNKESMKAFEGVIEKINKFNNDEVLYSLIIGDRLKKDLLALAVEYNFSIDRIDSLPNEITDTKPKKKSIVFFRLHRKQSDSILLREYSSVGIKTMALRNEKIIQKKDLYSKASVSDLLKERFVKPSVYKKAVEVSFSKELSIFYKCYPDPEKSYTYRVIAFLRENIKDGSKAKEGCRIAKSEKEKRLHCTSEELVSKIANWLLKEYILHPNISAIASDLIKEKLSPKAPISLRGFWLTNKHRLSDSGEEVLNTLEELALDEHVGALMVGEATGKEYETAICDYLPSKRLNIYLEALEELLEFARKAKLYDINPVSSIFYIKRKEKADYDSVRSALTKKTFSRDEEAKLVRRLLKTAASDPYHLAVLIQIFTGLSVNEVSALKKINLVKLQHSGGYYLSVHETIKNENGKYKLIVHNKREKHRKIPVIPLISDFLKTPENSDSEYLLLHPGTNEPLRPWKISETIRKLIKEELNIGEDLITLPDKDGNGKVTDLNKYFGSFLKANFRYRLLNACKMEEMECDYLLGNQRKNAYGKNYCDFSNDFLQINLYKKLLRWEAWYSQTKRIPQLQSINSKGIHLTEKGSRICLSANIHVNDTVKIKINSKNGVSGTVFVKRGDESE